MKLSRLITLMDLNSPNKSLQLKLLKSLRKKHQLIKLNRVVQISKLFSRSSEKKLEMMARMFKSLLIELRLFKTRIKTMNNILLHSNWRSQLTNS